MTKKEITSEQMFKDSLEQNAREYRDIQKDDSLPKRTKAKLLNSSEKKRRAIFKVHCRNESNEHYRRWVTVPMLVLIGACLLTGIVAAIYSGQRAKNVEQLSQHEFDTGGVKTMALL